MHIPQVRLVEKRNADLADLWPRLITCIHSDYSFLISLRKHKLTGREIFRGACAQIKTYPVIISQCLKCNYRIDLSRYSLISLESSALFEPKLETRYRSARAIFRPLQMVRYYRAGFRFQTVWIINRDSSAGNLQTFRCLINCSFGI